MRKKWSLLGGILVACWTVALGVCAAQTLVDASLQVALGAPYLDNTVLQQRIPLPIWCQTEPDAKVTVVFDSS